MTALFTSSSSSMTRKPVPGLSVEACEDGVAGATDVESGPLEVAVVGVWAEVFSLVLHTCTLCQPRIPQAICIDDI